MFKFKINPNWVVLGGCLKVSVLVAVLCVE